MSPIQLNNGVSIPQLGFGTWQIPLGDTKRLVLDALEVGYRHIDTAQTYGNESGVGEALAASGLSRDEVFVTTKLDNPDHARERVSASLDESLERLGMDQIDLFLVHWPLPTTDFDLIETWQGMEDVYAAGKARAIGVSNHQPNHLRRIAAEGTVVPAVNQIEIHPYFAQDELRAVNAEHSIATQAWSPLAQGQVFDDPALAAMATEVGRSVAQVVLRWHLQRGDIVFPKASTRERLAENFDVFDFELSEATMAAITAMDAGRRVGPDPDTYDRMG